MAWLDQLDRKESKEQIQMNTKILAGTFTFIIQIIQKDFSYHKLQDTISFEVSWMINIKKVMFLLPPLFLTIECFSSMLQFRSDSAIPRPSFQPSTESPHSSKTTSVISCYLISSRSPPLSLRPFLTQVQPLTTF